MNPRVKGRSKAFNITIINPEFCPIAITQGAQEFWVETNDVPTFSNLAVSVDNTANGQNATYQIDFTPEVDLIQNDTMAVVFS